jgi:hypothetical protein
MPNTETPKKRPGRPAGSKNKPKEGEASVAPSTLAPAEADSVLKGFTLYVNCLPVGLPVQELAEYIAPIHAEFCAAAQVQHYRFIDFGKGPALFADFVSKALASDPPSEHLVLDMRTQAGSDLYQVLAEKASLVVRGVA